jgi:hypothetical protein
MKKPRRIAAILAASTPPSHQTSPSVLEIRALRAASNHAIATGDLHTISATLADDFVVIIGDGTLLSRDAYLEAFAHNFQQPMPLIYERIPDAIHLSVSLPLAAEQGHWIGRLSVAQAGDQTGGQPNSHQNGIVLFTGTYSAMWRRTGSAWHLRSELFVSLT